MPMIGDPLFEIVQGGPHWLAADLPRVSEAPAPRLDETLTQRVIALEQAVADLRRPWYVRWAAACRRWWIRVKEKVNG
jgi:hypothetical protein